MSSGVTVDPERDEGFVGARICLFETSSCVESQWHVHADGLAPSSSAQSTQPITLVVSHAAIAAVTTWTDW